MYSWFPITQTLANSNKNRIPLDFHHKFTVILPLVTRTLDNSNLLLTRSRLCFPSDHLYIILPLIARTMFWALQKSGKNSVLASETLNFEFPIDVLYAYSFLLEADVVCRKFMWNCFTSQNSKTHALFRQCFVTALRSDL